MNEARAPSITANYMATFSHSEIIFEIIFSALMIRMNIWELRGWVCSMYILWGPHSMEFEVSSVKWLHQSPSDTNVVSLIIRQPSNLTANLSVNLSTNLNATVPLMSLDH